MENSKENDTRADGHAYRKRTSIHQPYRDGRQKPSLDTLLRICCALELDISDLLLDMSNVKKNQITTRIREIELLLDGCNDCEAIVILRTARALKAILKQCKM